MSQLNNPAITLLCEQDQGDRGDYLNSPTPENWQSVIKRDIERRARVIELMQENALQTADDFFQAGLIMLHGDDAKELVLGHVFAMAASAKGHEAAAWLSAMTLDRFLQSLEQGQVFDSQPPVKSDNVTMYKVVEKTVFIPAAMKEIFAAPPDDAC